VSLRAFHVLFIVVSLVTAFGFGVWSFNNDAPLMGSLSVAGGVALLVYGQWFLRKGVRSRDDDDRRRRKMIRTVKAVGILLAIGLATTEPAQACTVCFGEAEGPLIDAAKMGVFLLFGLVLAVQIGIGWFFVSLRKRMKRFSDHG
jgi:hypothetical protein